MKLPNDGSFPMGKIIVVVAIVGIGLFFWQNRKKTSLQNNTTPPPSMAAPIQPPQPNHHVGTLPYPGGPAGYTGSSTCRECHESQFDSWHRSYHRTMTQPLTPETVRADFDNVVLESNGEQFQLSQTNGTYWVSIGDTAPAPDTAAPPPSVNLQLAMLTGSHHMQVFWLPGVYGNMQIGFPFTWLIEDQRWVPRPDTFIRDPHAEPVVEIWNQVCIRCHTTGGIPKPNAEQQVFESEAVELGISCEACHGPAETHVALRRQEKSTGNQISAAQDPIIQPADLTAERSAMVCGGCHSMKWFDKNEQWEAHGFRFRPGDDLNETTPVIRASQTDQQPWLDSVLERNPGLLRSFFWSDGMIRVSGREYNGLIESACHTKGDMSCVSCHSLHNSDPNDQLARNRTGNQACTQCHESIGQSISEHTHHDPTSAGSLCYNCHMPHTTYGILKAIRSHEIGSPTVAAEQATGRPNACNLCHVNQTLAWTADHLEQWFQQSTPELSEDERQIPAVARHLLQGDAGQRALAAWTLGWAPAQEVAGHQWLGNLLAKSLEDPYSAVRYIAGKSLKQIAGFENFSYDFVALEPRRQAAAQAARNQWLSQRPESIDTNPKTSFFDESGYPKPTEIERLWSTQDQTPIRLRE